MNPSEMNLVKLDRNYYIDTNTETTFEFIYDRQVTDEAAEHEIFKWFDHWMKHMPPKDFYGRNHLMLQMGYVDPPQ